MEQALPQRCLAVLIDGENVSHRLAPTIFDEIRRRFGRTCVRRVYGDFHGPANGWSAEAARFAVEMRHCADPARGKNGADMKLAMDVVDLVRDGGLDGFCLVSSDADFAEVALRVRRDGLLAYGFGKAEVADHYRLACDEYIEIASAPVARPAANPAAGGPHAALPALRAALGKAVPENGWYRLSTFGNLARAENVDPGNYGAGKLSDLLRETGQFELDKGNERFRPIALRAVGA
jgi:hypothetical protein